MERWNLLFLVKLCYIFRLPSPGVSSTHWMVTEDGRIQAQLNSIYHLKRPYDLVSLLQQEKRAILLSTLKQELDSQKDEIDRHDDQDINVEDKLYATDENCVAAGIPLNEINFYPTTYISLASRNIKIDDHLPEPNRNLENESGLQEPYCDDFIDVAYTPRAMDHLSSITEREKLSVEPELSLSKMATELNQLGDALADRIYQALVQNKTSWVVYNIAATYWRFRGNAEVSIECLRRALFYCPHPNIDIPLMQLANVLHNAKHSSDAVVVLNTAIEFNANESTVHFLLGNVFMILVEHDKARAAYEQSLKLKPDFSEAIRMVNALLCHQKLEASLENQHNQLQRTLAELQSYQARHRMWIEQQEKFMQEQALPSVKLASRLAYEEIKILTNNKKNAQALAAAAAQVGNIISDRECKQYYQNGHVFLSCSLGEDALNLLTGGTGSLVNGEVLSPSDLMFISSGLTHLEWVQDKLFKAAETAKSVSRLSSLAMTLSEQQAAALDESGKKMKCDATNYDLDDSVDASCDGVKKQKKHISKEIVDDDPLPDIINRAVVSGAIRKPTVKECQTMTKVDLGQFTSTWLDLSAKHISVKDFIDFTETIDYPRKPYCNAEVPSSLLTMDHLSGIRHRNKLKYEPETGLTEVLRTLHTNSAGVSSVSSSPLSIDETASHIAVAIESNRTSWILATCAALYWRVVGNSDQAVNCLRTALYHAPWNVKDIPLLSLCNILHKAGLHNGALVLANMALDISPKFVVIHFAIANIYAAKGDFVEAAKFYESTLALHSGFEPARERLKAIKCRRN